MTTTEQINKTTETDNQVITAAELRGDDNSRQPAVAHWCDELGDLTTFFDDCGCDEIRVADVLVSLIDASLATLGTDDCGKTDIESHDAMTFLINLRERILTLKVQTLAEYADIYGDDGTQG